MEKVKEKVIISFMNDLFFKVALGSNNQKSKMLLKMILKYLTGLNLINIIIMNSELPPQEYQGKEIILDIHASDDKNNRYNIEMQTSKYSKRLYYRFQYYACKMVVDALDEGEDYTKLPNVYQIVFINDKDKAGELVRKITLKDQHNKELENGLLCIIYVNIAAIDKIVAKKGMDGLDDFELLVYLFKHGEDSDIIRLEKQGNEVLKIMSEKYNKFVNNDKMYSWAANIQRVKKENEAMIEYYKEEALETGLKEGHAQGLVEGHAEGLKEGLCYAIKFLNEQIRHKYGVTVNEWLEQLSKDDLDKVAKEIYNCETLDELKQTVIRQ